MKIHVLLLCTTLFFSCSQVVEEKADIIEDNEAEELIELDSLPEPEEGINLDNRIRLETGTTNNFIDFESKSNPHLITISVIGDSITGSYYMPDGDYALDLNGNYDTSQKSYTSKLTAGNLEIEELNFHILKSGIMKGVHVQKKGIGSLPFTAQIVNISNKSFGRSPEKIEGVYIMKGSNYEEGRPVIKVEQLGSATFFVQYKMDGPLEKRDILAGGVGDLISKDSMIVKNDEFTIGWLIFNAKNNLSFHKKDESNVPFGASGDYVKEPY